MIAKSQARHVRLAPRKVRQVIDLIRGKDVEEARVLLSFLDKRPKETLLKVLKTAVANAKTKGIDSKKLYISKAVCNSGPHWKRFKAAAFGRAAPILKRTSHISLELDLKA
jgi:large subunit ribosomal protein L22